MHPKTKRQQHVGLSKTDSFHIHLGSLGTCTQQEVYMMSNEVGADKYLST